jgi:hypothetical protein
MDRQFFTDHAANYEVLYFGNSAKPTIPSEKTSQENRKRPYLCSQNPADKLQNIYAALTEA